MCHKSNNNNNNLKCNVGKLMFTILKGVSQFAVSYRLCCLNA